MFRRHRAGRAEESLGASHRRRIETPGKRTAGAAFDRVVCTRHARDRIENDYDVLAQLHQAARPLQYHFGDIGVAYRGHVEAGGDDLAIAPGDHLTHFLGTLVDEQNQQRCLRMIDRHAFDDRLQKHRFPGARWRDD